MKFSSALLFVAILFSPLSIAGDLKSKIRKDVRVVKKISLNAHDSGQFEIDSKSDLWIGFNFEFPQNRIAAHKGKYVFEIKDKNSFGGISTGPVDNSASTLFEEKDGKVIVSYQNNTDLNYKVIFWVRSI